MTIKKLKDFIESMDLEDSVEVRIVDQEENGTYYHNSVENIEVSSDKYGKYIILSSEEEL